MKRIAFFALFLFALQFVSCTNQEAEQAAAKAKQDSILQVQEDSLLNIFRNELQAIADKVTDVNVQHGLISLDTAEGAVLSKETIMSQVESLNDLLGSNQKQLNDLYKRMKDSKVKNEQLENMIKGMQERIAQRESQIDDLMKMLQEKDVQIEQIINRVDSMRLTNIELTEDIVHMDEEMHTVWYCVGENKELKEKGVITKDGGLLGLGGTKKLDVSQLDQSLFKESDERDLKTIPLYSKKAKLITNHPDGSYEFTLDENGGVVSLEIKDRVRFWTATDYLVVEVSN